MDYTIIVKWKKKLNKKYVSKNNIEIVHKKFRQSWKEGPLTYLGSFVPAFASRNQHYTLFL